jgi:HlyD family secretion protein
LKQESDSPQKKEYAHNHKLRNAILIAVAVIVIGSIAWAKLSGNRGADKAEPLFTVTRGDLRISVLEAGNIEANRSVTLTSEMDDETTILSLVPEGTYVNEGDVLVKLDASSHKDEIDRHQIIVDSAKADLKTAQEAYEIQKNQNESDLRAAQLAVEFARIDLEKYTAGESEEQLTRAAQAALGFADELFSNYAKEEWAKQLGETDIAPANLSGKDEKDSPAGNRDISLDFAEMGLDKLAGGDWHQQLRNALYLIVQADTNLKLAKDAYDGSRKLFEKKYVTETQLRADESKFQSAVIDLKKAVEALRLLINYDHPKQLAKLRADYEEAKRELERTDRKAASKLAQKEADRSALESTYRMEKERLDRYKDQLNKSVIKAPQPGLVIYASSMEGRGHMHRGRGMIAEGETVYERQPLIILPDLSKLKVQMRLNESVRDIVKPDQQAIITFEGVPDLTLHGQVEKVALLPDSEENWMNPDLTVYPATITLDAVSEALKPGMTAKVEIIIADLKNVLYVPVQAVTIRENQDVCSVVKGGKKEETPVVVGLSNNNYIEIKSGLKQGDTVLTNAPITVTEATGLKKPDIAEFEKKRTPRADKAAAQPKGEEEKPETLPADMQERAKAFLENLTPEQKKQMEERLKSLGIEGEITPEKLRKLMEQRGGPRPGGERPFGAPGSPGSSGEPRPRGPSSVGTRAEGTNQPVNQ